MQKIVPSEDSMTGQTPVRTPFAGSSQQELVTALVGCDERADKAVSRTRRMVQSAVINMEERRQNGRKKAGMGLLIAVLFLTLLAPALWSSVETIWSGAHFADIQTQAYLLAVMLFPGIVAAAIAAFSRQRGASSRQS